MKKIVSLAILILFFTSCVGVSSKGVFGTGVSIAIDPRTLGTQIDDAIMEKNLVGRLVTIESKYFLNINVKVIDGRIFLTGKVEDPEEKLKITKMAWETRGTRSVRNDLKIKEKFNIKISSKDLLITSQLKYAMIINDKIKTANYNIDTYKKKIYIYGIAMDEEERRAVINEAKQVLDVQDVIPSILLLEDLSRKSN